MSTIPAMDRMGAELEAALRRRERARPWWRTRRLLGVLAALAVVAVPAAGSQVDWAGLVNGETALPTQAGPDVRTVLASGERHRASAWQLVVYRARIATADGTGPVGLCTYVTLPLAASGSGRCTANAARAPALLVASRGDSVGVLAGVVGARAARVELTLRDGRRLAVAPQTPDPALLVKRALPAPLRFFVVDVTSHGTAQLVGVRVLDRAGEEIARSGRPGSVPASAPLLRSPVTIGPEEAP